MRSIPNIITILRLILIVPIGFFLWVGEYGISLICLICAGVSDALDGYLARKLNSISRFGELADPIADKLLVFVVVLLLLIKELLPLWVALIVMGREIVIVSGALAFRSIVHELEISPLLVSRVNTGVQVVVLVLILISNTDSVLFGGISELLVNEIGLYLLALFAVISGLAYVIAWSGRLRVFLTQTQDEAR